MYPLMHHPMYPLMHPPTNVPTDAPKNVPTGAPSDVPTNEPTDAPTNVPNDAPFNVHANDNALIYNSFVTMHSFTIVFLFECFYFDGYGDVVIVFVFYFELKPPSIDKTNITDKKL